jgi:hypothetical protein
MSKSYKYNQEQYGDNYKSFQRFKKEKSQKNKQEQKNEQWQEQDERRD